MLFSRHGSKFIIGQKDRSQSAVLFTGTGVKDSKTKSRVFDFLGESGFVCGTRL
jgi:hypothetical protein